MTEKLEEYEKREREKKKEGKEEDKEEGELEKDGLGERWGNWRKG